MYLFFELIICKFKNITTYTSCVLIFLSNNFMSRTLVEISEGKFSKCCLIYAENFPALCVKRKKYYKRMGLYNIYTYLYEMIYRYIIFMDEGGLYGSRKENVYIRIDNSLVEKMRYIWMYIICFCYLHFFCSKHVRGDNYNDALLLYNIYVHKATNGRFFVTSPLNFTPSNVFIF